MAKTPADEQHSQITGLDIPPAKSEGIVNKVIQ